MQKGKTISATKSRPARGKAPTAPPVSMIPLHWVSFFASTFFLLAALIWIGVFNPTWNKVAILGLFSLYYLIVLVFHFYFQKWALTSIVIIGGLSLILLALNVYSPQEIARKLETHTVAGH
jgi:hypothetical protein